jgi:alcohol dehydrogenase class IV
MGTPVDSTYQPLAGLWQPSQLKRMYYGPGSVEKYLTACLPTSESRAFIVTGSSLANKTNLINQVEQLLASKHAGTFSQISQHAPVDRVEECAELVKKDKHIDTVISIGGGSPIDAAKVVSSRVNDHHGKYLYHISIPTTLSVAECTSFAGYTEKDGTKQAVRGPELAPHVIIYDASFAKKTPVWLLESTAIRALDHAVELMYNPTAAEAPTKHLCVAAIKIFFDNLPKHKRDPNDDNVLTTLQLASFNSLYPIGLNLKGSIGLSHTMGYALGSPYGIPHGITSCLTLAGVVRLKAQSDPEAAAQLARVLPYVGKTPSGDHKKDALALADAIEGLVKELGLATSLTEYKVGKNQVPIITARATGGKKDGPIYDAVSKLVESLY